MLFVVYIKESIRDNEVLAD